MTNLDDTNLDVLFDTKLKEFLSTVKEEANKRLEGAGIVVETVWFLYNYESVEFEFADGTESKRVYYNEIEEYIEELVNNGI